MRLCTTGHVAPTCGCACVEHAGDTLDTVPAVALCGGAAIYLLGHVAFLYRSTQRIWRRRSYGAVTLLALLPAALTIPSLAALGLVSVVCVAVVAGEAIGRREHRTMIRAQRYSA